MTEWELNSEFVEYAKKIAKENSLPIKEIEKIFLNAEKTSDFPDFCMWKNVRLYDEIFAMILTNEIYDDDTKIWHLSVIPNPDINGSPQGVLSQRLLKEVPKIVLGENFIPIPVPMLEAIAQFIQKDESPDLQSTQKMV